MSKSLTTFSQEKVSYTPTAISKWYGFNNGNIYFYDNGIIKKFNLILKTFENYKSYALSLSAPLSIDLAFDLDTIYDIYGTIYKTSSAPTRYASYVRLYKRSLSGSTSSITLKSETSIVTSYGCSGGTIIHSDGIYSIYKYKSYATLSYYSDSESTINAGYYVDIDNALWGLSLYEKETYRRVIGIVPYENYFYTPTSRIDNSELMTYNLLPINLNEMYFIVDGKAQHYIYDTGDLTTLAKDEYNIEQYAYSIPCQIGSDYYIVTQQSDGFVLSKFSVKEYSNNYTILNKTGTETYLTIEDQFPISKLKIVTSGNVVAWQITWLDNSTDSYNYTTTPPDDYRLIGYSLTPNRNNVDIPLNVEVTVDIEESANLYEVYGKYNPITEPTDINLYKCSSDPRQLDKTDYLTTVGVLAGVLRNESGINNPTIFFEYSKLPDFNYVYIEAFNRWYYVDDVESVNLYLWRVHLSVDVRMTYKDTYLSSAGFIARNQFDFNELLRDTERPFISHAIHTTVGAVSDFVFNNYAGTGTAEKEIYRYILTCIAGVNDNTNPTTITTSFCTNTKYILNAIQMDTFTKDLNNTDLWTSIKNLFANNPMESIISMRAYPIDLHALLIASGDELDNVNLADYETNAKGYICRYSPDNNASFRVGYIDFTSYGKYWWEYEDKINIFLPYIGFTNVTPSDVYGKYLHVYYIVDWNTGTATVNLYASGTTAEIDPDSASSGRTLVNTLSGNFGIDIPVSASNAQDQIKSLLSTGLNLAVGAATGGVGLALAAGSAMNAAQALTPSYGVKGSMGGSYAGNYSYQNVFAILDRAQPVFYTDSDVTRYEQIYGKPLNEYRSLSDVYGLTTLDNIRLEDFKTATKEELHLIADSLKEGIILGEKLETAHAAIRYFNYEPALPTIEVTADINFTYQNQTSTTCTAIRATPSAIYFTIDGIETEVYNTTDGWINDDVMIITQPENTKVNVYFYNWYIGIPLSQPYEVWGTWTWNDEPAQPDADIFFGDAHDPVYAFTFTTDGDDIAMTVTGGKIAKTDGIYCKITYNESEIFYGDDSSGTEEPTWFNSYYKVMNIAKGTYYTVSGDFYSYLKSNAIKS